jgi:hypothetical protein
VVPLVLLGAPTGAHMMGTRLVADIPDDVVARLVVVCSELDGPQALRVAVSAAMYAHALRVEPGHYDMDGLHCQADAIVERSTVTIIVRAL